MPKKTDKVPASEITFRDIIVIGDYNGRNPCGEFNPPEEFGGTARHPMEDQESVSIRLYEEIKELILEASSIHKVDNCRVGSNDLAPDMVNSITRLITNEFFFYTKNPFSVKEFQMLQQKIANLACQQPKNLHLILGSFAVQTHKNVMNVVPTIECGYKPRIHFVVKNLESPIDPIYSIIENGKRKILPNIVSDKKLPGPISIKGVGECPFSFNNVYLRKTAGHVPFYSCTEICLDHYNGIGKKNFHRQVERDHRSDPGALSNLYSHIVVSNTAPLIPQHSMGTVTHADPIHSSQYDCKKGLSKQVLIIPGSHFGTPAKMIVCNTAPCNTFSRDMALLMNTLMEYQLSRKLECGNQDPAANFKYRLFNKRLGFTAEEKMEAVDHLLNLLSQKPGIAPLSGREMDILQDGRLGKLIMKFNPVFEKHLPELNNSLKTPSLQG